MFATLRTVAADGADGAAEASLLALAAVTQAMGTHAEPFVLPVLAAALARASSKASGLRAAAESVVQALLAVLPPAALPLVLPVCFAAFTSSTPWQTKKLAADLIGQLALKPSSEGPFSAALPELVPALASICYDPKPIVGALSLRPTPPMHARPASTHPSPSPSPFLSQARSRRRRSACAAPW